MKKKNEKIYYENLAFIDFIIYFCCFLLLFFVLLFFFVFCFFFWGGGCFVSFSNPGCTYLFRRLSFITLFTVLL